MNKRLFVLPLLLTGSTMRPVDKEAKKVEKVDPFEDLFSSIKQDMQRFQKRFDAIEQYMFNGFDQLNEEVKKDKDTKQAAQKMIEIATKDAIVSIKMHLGELKAQDVTIEVDGDSLTGKTPLKDGSATFYIQNGIVFGLSVKREVKKDEGDKEKKSVVQVSESTKMETLPTYVENLEKTEVVYQNGILELKMPMIPQKKGTKLNVVAK